jgi:hypothetical protein
VKDHHFHLFFVIFQASLNGAGIYYSGGFSTDISESCIWITPFIKEPGDFWDLRFYF